MSSRSFLAGLVSVLSIKESLSTPTQSQTSEAVIGDFVGVRFDAGVTAAEAQEYCSFYYYSLATITSDSENSQAIGAISSVGLYYTRIWIGYTDSETYGASEGQFLWMNGDSSTYTKWGFGQPNNYGNEDCTVISTFWGGTWEDVNCDQKTNAFVCLVSQQNPTLSQSDTVEAVSSTGQFVAVRPTGSVDFAVAREYCLYYYSNLATVRYYGQNQEILSAAYGTGLSGNVGVWIGYTDDADFGAAGDGSFSWVDGSSSGYTQWAYGPPSANGADDCAEIKMAWNGQWNAETCTSTAEGFACARPTSAKDIKDYAGNKGKELGVIAASHSSESSNFSLSDYKIYGFAGLLVTFSVFVIISLLKCCGINIFSNDYKDIDNQEKEEEEATNVVV